MPLAHTLQQTNLTDALKHNFKNVCAKHIGKTPECVIPQAHIASHLTNSPPGRRCHHRRCPPTPSSEATAPHASWQLSTPTPTIWGLPGTMAPLATLAPLQACSCSEAQRWRQHVTAEEQLPAANQAGSAKSGLVPREGVRRWFLLRPSCRNARRLLKQEARLDKLLP